MIFTVAIDACGGGQGHDWSALAAQFGFAHLDTGLLYRAGRWAVIRWRRRGAASGGFAARRSAIDGCGTGGEPGGGDPEVRAALVDFQRRFARGEGGAVLDGRDIGTVICPEAEVKLYITASAEVRASALAGGGRRWARVLAEVVERDARDMGRAEAPLKPAVDAVVIDTSDMPIDAAIAAAVALVKARL